MLFSIIKSGWTWERSITVILAYVLSIMIALVLHEVAHAFAALKAGDPSAKFARRLSLNPMRHIEPLGLLSFLLIGIGWAKPVPCNPFNYRNFRRGNFWVSFSGVLTNFILGFLFSLAYFLMCRYAGFGYMDANLWVWTFGWFFSFGMVINVSLMIFNLLPIPPLDGYNMLRSFTKPNNRFMAFMRNNGMWVLLVILIVSSTTGGIYHLRNGIIWCFENLWGAIFK